MSKIYSINLSEMPKIFQVGLNEHGIVKNETFIMKDLWSLHLYRWKGLLQVEGSKFLIKPGCISLCPPGVPLQWSYHSKNAMHYYVHFYLGKSNDKDVKFPVFCEYPDLMTASSETMEQIIRDFKRYPLKANVKFWDFLWDITLLKPHQGKNIVSSQRILAF